MSLSDTSPCPKCAMSSKYGKMSCCARGGAWYDHCGDDGGNYEHTWFEGVQACQSKLAAVSIRGLTLDVNVCLIYIFVLTFH